MKSKHKSGHSNQMERALEELKALVQRRYPDAIFDVAHGEDDAEEVHLIATVDIEDPDQVVDLVIERVLQFQTEEDLPIHVIPVRPVGREIQELSQPRRKVRPTIDVEIAPAIEP